MKIRVRNIFKRKSSSKKEEIELYDPFFHDHRFKIVEQQLSPETKKKFKSLSNEDKALFVNVLIKEGKLTW